MRWLSVAVLLPACLLAAPATAQEHSQSKIPLRPGLTIVTAVTREGIGDFESIKRITTVDADGVTLTYNADLPTGGDALSSLMGALGGEQKEGTGDRKPGDARHVHGSRTVRRQDLLKAHDYMQYFGEGIPQTIPGSTALGVSRSVLLDLRAKKQSRLSVRDTGIVAGLGTGLSSMIQRMAGSEMKEAVDTSELEELDVLKGSIHRVEPEPVAFELQVNGKTTRLPSIHATGKLGDRPCEFYFLDDPENPLALAWTIGETDGLRVIRIEVPPASPEHGTAERIAEDLAATGRAVVYGIYFDFASDKLKPESQPVLQEIASALKAHVDWRLSIEGHTDSIGGQAYNQDLSSRRAAAVKRALVEDYRVAPTRLTTVGYGESRPKASNETVEGRALNRRVELVRR
jgi:outer membrane protein OmpA-like peptidoglycan-associated protein